MNALIDLWEENAMKCMKYHPLTLTMNFWTDGTAEKTYEKYKSAVSDSLMQLYRTPGFAASSWEMQKSMAGPWKLFISMAEHSMKAMNMPTEKDLEELTLRCDYLEDKVKKLTEQINHPDSKEESSPSPAKISRETSELPLNDGGSKEEPRTAKPRKPKRSRK